MWRSPVKPGRLQETVDGGQFQLQAENETNHPSMQAKDASGARPATRSTGDNFLVSPLTTPKRKRGRPAGSVKKKDANNNNSGGIRSRINSLDRYLSRRELKENDSQEESPVREESMIFMSSGLLQRTPSHLKKVDIAGTDTRKTLFPETASGEGGILDGEGNTQGIEAASPSMTDKDAQSEEPPDLSFVTEEVSATPTDLLTGGSTGTGTTLQEQRFAATADLSNRILEGVVRHLDYWGGMIEEACMRTRLRAEVMQERLLEEIGTLRQQLQVLETQKQSTCHHCGQQRGNNHPEGAEEVKGTVEPASTREKRRERRGKSSARSTKSPKKKKRHRRSTGSIPGERNDMHIHSTPPSNSQVIRGAHCSQQQQRTTEMNRSQREDRQEESRTSQAPRRREPLANEGTGNTAMRDNRTLTSPPKPRAPPRLREEEIQPELQARAHRKRNIIVKGWENLASRPNQGHLQYEVCEAIERATGVKPEVVRLLVIDKDIILQLRTVRNKIDLIRRKRRLRRLAGFNLWLDDDLTAREVQVQKWLQSEADRVKSQGQDAKVGYFKIIYDKNCWKWNEVTGDFERQPWRQPFRVQKY